MRRLLFFVVFAASLVAGVFFNLADRNREVFRSICDLTESNFYKSGPALDQWVRRCRLFAAQTPWNRPVKDLVEDIQNHMASLEVSHFQIYSPAEDKKLWTGVAVDTGIRARYIEDRLIVYRVLVGSAGLSAGVRAGDEIVAISGTDQVTPWGAQNRSGTFTIARAGKEITLEIIATELTIDGGPRLTALRGGAGLLEISSFRSEFFEAEAWRKMAGGLNSYSHVIVDLRENAGGNFVAMLRALSPFLCEPERVGTLSRPRFSGPDKPTFEDVTDDAYQIDEITRHRSLGLKTFADYGCYRGRVTVLISSDTASVAEIFAQSFIGRPRARVWGQPTAGDVVLAIWYDLPALGAGYSVSIPEAVYVTPEEVELENRGVGPQREIYYNLKQALAGRDTFIEEALR